MSIAQLAAHQSKIQNRQNALQYRGIHGETRWNLYRYLLGNPQVKLEIGLKKAHFWSTFPEMKNCTKAAQKLHSFFKSRAKK